MTSLRAAGSPVCSMSDQILPAGSQKRAKAQRFSLSLRVSVGPSKI
jgi:hypothetical protein